MAPRMQVLAYIEDHPKAIMVLRAARARAQEKGYAWVAVYLETPAQATSADQSAHARMLRLLTLAQQMGGETLHFETQTIDEGMRRVLEAAKDRLCLCVVGSTEAEYHWRFWERRMPSWQRVVRLASTYTPVETVPLSGQPFVRSLWRWPNLDSFRLRHLLYALLSVGVAFGCAVLLQWALPPALFRINSRNVALLFMIACAFSASRFGMIPGLLASVIGFFAANYYFIPPYRSLQISTITEALDMILFLAAAVLIALFTSQTRTLAERAKRREISTQALFMLYRIASDAFTHSQALGKLQRTLTHMLEMDVAFFLPPTLSPDRIEAAFPPDLSLSNGDTMALGTCWKEMKTTGLASPFNPGSAWRFEPMIAPGGEIGVLGVRPRKKHQLDPWYGRLLTSIADQTASVLEHIELERSMEATRIREEREKLRSMLLSSVSHDLKTPLAGIIGALSVHQSLGSRLPPARRADLLETALEEAHRLDSFITNILDMTKLESGSVEFHCEWHDMGSLISQVTKRLQHRLRKHPLTVHPVPAGIEVHMDVMMVEQVLQNLLDNACKYTPTGTPIDITCRLDERGYMVEVRDHGPGIPPDRLDKIFDKYARLQKEDAQIAGTGLGLAIARAVMEAQDGWISVANHKDGGAVFTCCLRQWRKTESAPLVQIETPIEQPIAQACIR